MNCDTNLLLLLIVDAYFYYGLEATRVLLDINLGYEMFLTFAYPGDYDANILLIGIVINLFFALLTDSLLGRLPIVIFGLFALIITTIINSILIFIDSFPMFHNNPELKQITIIFCFIYMSTSSVRNVLHLEQISLPTNFLFIRRYIFWTIFLRLVVMFVFNYLMLILRGLDNVIFLRVHSLINVFSVSVYVVVLLHLYFFKQLRIEKIRKGIWCKGIYTFTLALLPNKDTRSEWDARVLREQHRSTQRSTMARPVRRRDLKISQSDRRTMTPQQKLYAFFLLYSFSGPVKQKGIMTNQHPGDRMKEKRLSKNDTYESTSMGTTLAPDKYPSGKIPSQNIPRSNVAPFVLLLKTETDTGYDTKRSNGRSLPGWNIFNALHRLFFKRRTSKPLQYEYHLDEQDPYFELKCHWLYRAKNKSTLSIMEETRRFWLVKFIFITSFTFNLSSYFILVAIIMQNKLCRRPDSKFINELTMSVCYSFLNMILFPFCEFLVIPFLRRYKLCHTDLKIVALSSFLLLIALLAVVATQKHLESNLQYIPTDYFAQMRIYNALPSSISLSSSAFGLRLLHPFQVKLIKDIRGEGIFNVTLRVENSDLSVENTVIVTLKAKSTFSYLVTEKGFEPNNPTGPDPTIYTEERNDSMSSFFIVTKIKINGFLNFTNVQSNGRVTHPIPPAGVKISLFPGVYDVSMFSKGSIEGPKSFEIGPGGLYGIFIYEQTKNRNDLTIFAAEGPPNLFIGILLIQLIILCFSQALATVAFFKFLFIESSSKLRCTTFTCVYISGLCAVAISSTYVVQSSHSMFSSVLWAVIALHIVGMLSTIYSSANYVHYYAYMKIQ